jgi:hypothetical protein
MALKAEAVKLNASGHASGLRSGHASGLRSSACRWLVPGASEVSQKTAGCLQVLVQLFAGCLQVWRGKSGTRAPPRPCTKFYATAGTAAAARHTTA